MSFFKKIGVVLLSQKVLIGSRQRLILAYHDVSEPNSPQYSELYSTTPANFTAQIDFVGKHFKFVTPEEIVSPDYQNEERLACVTFDDGFRTVKTEAMPILAARRIPFAVFVNSHAVRHNFLLYDEQFAELNRRYQTKVYLDAAEIRELSDDGVLIGNHTSNHKILAQCGADELREEVLENKLYLENLLSKKINHLALPYGKREHYNQAALDYCFNSSDHNFVYSSNPVCFERADLNGEKLLVPRIGLTNTSAAELCFMINRPLLKKVDI